MRLLRRAPQEHHNRSLPSPGSIARFNAPLGTQSLATLSLLPIDHQAAISSKWDDRGDTVESVLIEGRPRTETKGNGFKHVNS